MTSEATNAVSVVPPLSGRMLFRFVPIRRRVMLENLQRVFGATLSPAEIVALAQAHYAHLWCSFREILESVGGRRSAVRVENVAALEEVHREGRGVLILTGHFGNWELAVTGAMAALPDAYGRFHFLRRPVRPLWLERLVYRRFERAGIGVLPKLGSLERILDRLAANHLVVFVMDQHAGGRDGVVVDFFGQPASTFRSLAVISLATGARVVPAASWREPDGRHVLRFEDSLPLLDHDDPREAIRRNTQQYNRALEALVLRHPEQWFWLHRRWK